MGIPESVYNDSAAIVRFSGRNFVFFSDAHGPASTDAAIFSGHACLMKRCSAFDCRNGEFLFQGNNNCINLLQSLKRSTGIAIRPQARPCTTAP